MEDIKDMHKIKSINDLNERLKKDDQLLNALKEHPEEVIEKLNQATVIPSTPVYMVAVGSLAGISIICVLGLIWLSGTLEQGQTLPSGLETIIGTAIGGLVGLLAPVSR